MSRLLALLSLTACGPAGPPAWMLDDSPSTARFVPPVLYAQELVVGETAQFLLTGAPPGLQVGVVISLVGEGDGPTLFGAVTSDVLGPVVVLGPTVTGARGNALIEYDVPDGLRPGTAWLHAVARDPVTGNTWTSPVLLRNVTVPEAFADVAFVDGSADAGGIDLLAGGNSHTGGCAWLDYNGDLWPDLFVSTGSGTDHALFRNDGDGTFTDVSHLVPKPDTALEDAGAASADVDNDGDDDLVVPVDAAEHMNAGGLNDRLGGPNLLYVNQGDGTFVESAAASGLVDPRGWRNITAAFSDWDRDGLVDLHLGSWAMNAVGDYDRVDRLLHNDGGTFSDVSGTVIDAGGLDTLTTLWFDADLDDWPDLYTGNVAYGNSDGYASADALYLNESGVFVDASAESPGAWDDARAAMGADVGDIDADGDWDLYVTDLFSFQIDPDPLPRGNVLYEGGGDGTFSDNSCDVRGVCSGYISWPTSFQDFDRDGWVDLFVGNVGGPQLVFVNERDGTFASHEVPGFGTIDAKGGATSDFDGDGDVDLYVQATLELSRLYRNDAVDAHHWLEVHLVGGVSNRSAIGATVVVEAGGVTQMRRVSGGDSAHSQSDRTLHFGLREATEATVSVRWPTGVIEDLGVLAADGLWVVDEGAGVRAEALVEVAAVAADGALALEVRSNLGGRTTFSAEGYGDLAWDPDALAFTGVFAWVGDAPTSVTLTNPRGAWDVAVQAP